MLFCGKLPVCVLERTVAFQQEEEVSFAKYSNSRLMTQRIRTWWTEGAVSSHVSF